MTSFTGRRLVRPRTAAPLSLGNMKTSCIRHTEIPSSSRLFKDYVYSFGEVSRFYQHPPLPDQFAAAAGRVQITAEHRAALVGALRKQNAAAGAETSANLDRLAQEDTVVVATGQQVGLYGGPVFAVYKALTAIRLAEELGKEGISAVPVFWLATEDHDLGEVEQTWILDHENQPLHIEAKTQALPAQPVGGVRLTDPGHEAVTATLANLPFGEFAIRLASEAYSEECSFGTGFRALFEQLFGRYGLILLDPMDPAIRRLSAPLLRKAIERAGDLNTELVARSEDLERAGYHAQVHVTGETSPVFLIDARQRTALRLHESNYDAGETSYSTPDLLRKLEQNPEQFSPNVLLRPVIQDFLLPTAVYVAGPAELAYLAQAEVLYSSLLGRMPVVLPRAFFTILDARAEKYLSRYKLSLPDCLEGADTLREKISQRLIPPGLEQTFAEGQSQIESSLDAIGRDLAKFDPTLSAALGNARKKMLYQFEKIQAAVAREGLRRDSRAGQEAAHLSNLIFPNNTLQERTYSVLPFLARCGVGFIDRVHQAINPDCHHHQVLVI